MLIKIIQHSYSLPLTSIIIYCVYRHDVFSLTASGCFVSILPDFFFTPKTHDYEKNLSSQCMLHGPGVHCICGAGELLS
jgi:hypothetical protein